ncbi:acyl-CoA thioesterase [Mobilicoccus massiliensis]|uniref:acyl-CoA thioesterase n=1 Tax=Mobilicoccus massiliensis TaxID=1522310 RepID=UPI0009E1B7FA|nr:acyl-CoA thioesterase [Mobilicoccus massiliensis]
MDGAADRTGTHGGGESGDRPVAEACTPSSTQLTLASVMTALDTNLLGTVHGGNVMKSVDTAAGSVAARFSGGPAVTAAMDEMVFRAPVRVGDVLTVHAQVNWAGRSSMEVGVHVETTRWDELGDPVHVATAYLVMVAVDENGRPRPLPALVPETPDDHRRHAEAQIRREHRLRMREEIDRLRGGTR